MSNTLSISVPLRFSQLFTGEHGQILVKDVIRALKRVRDALPKQREMALDLNLSWQGNAFYQYQVTIVSQSCHFGNVRWWLKCAECDRHVFDLFWKQQRFTCRKCQGLRYISNTWTNPTRLMHHYGELRLKTVQRPGPKAKRCWRYLLREDQAFERVLIGLKKFGKRLKKRH